MPAPADSPKTVTRLGISAERGDVVAHPAQCRQHVSQPEIGVEPATRGVEFGQVEESERAEPIVHGDDDRFAAAGQHSTVVQRLARRAEDVGAAVHPHHHRLAVTGRGIRRRPDIEGETVLALRCAQVDRNPGVDGLRADVAEACRIGDVGPAFGRFGCPPPQVADRRRGVPHAFPCRHVPVVVAADRPVAGFYQGVVDRHHPPGYRRVAVDTVNSDTQWYI